MSLNEANELRKIVETCQMIDYIIRREVSVISVYSVQTVKDSHTETSIFTA